MSKFERVERNIYILREAIPHYEVGYYFNDEVEDMHGPFETIEETRELLNKYVEDLFSE